MTEGFTRLFNLEHKFRQFFNLMAADIHEGNVKNGWWDEARNGGEFIALVHSELSEALEGMRDGDPPDKHLPEFTSTEVELADAIIRIMDWAAFHKLRLSEALVAKAKYNQGRGYKHGRQF